MDNYNNLKDLIHFKGAIWISKTFASENRGNICLKNQHSGEFQVLAYISPSELENRDLKVVVETTLKASGLIKWLELDETMNIKEIHENSICKCSPSGDVITVTITADEYDFLTNTAGIEIKYAGYGDDLIELDYPDYQELISKAQENFY